MLGIDSTPIPNNNTIFKGFKDFRNYVQIIKWRNDQFKVLQSLSLFPYMIGFRFITKNESLGAKAFPRVQPRKKKYFNLKLLEICRCEDMIKNKNAK